VARPEAQPPTLLALGRVATSGATHTTDSAFLSKPDRQKNRRDNRERGDRPEGVMIRTNRRTDDAVHSRLLQVSVACINFQRVPLIDRCRPSQRHQHQHGGVELGCLVIRVQGLPLDVEHRH